MSALNVFRKSKKEQKGTFPKASKAAVSPAVQESGKEAKGKKGASALHIVRAHITEKAADLAKQNQYVFVAQPWAAKRDVKKDVENAYGVTVEAVRVVNVRPKDIRVGRRKGKKKGYKKAIVRVQAGQTIDILPK